MALILFSFFFKERDVCLRKWSLTLHQKMIPTTTLTLSEGRSSSSSTVLLSSPGSYTDERQSSSLSWSEPLTKTMSCLHWRGNFVRVWKEMRITYNKSTWKKQLFILHSSSYCKETFPSSPALAYRLSGEGVLPNPSLFNLHFSTFSHVLLRAPLQARSILECVDCWQSLFG